MTVEQWLHTWIALRAPELKPRTLDSYRDLIHRYIAPSIGSADLETLPPISVSALLASVMADGHSRTAELIYVLLKASLKELRPDLMARVPRPKHKQTSPEAWSDAHIAAYLAAISGHRQQLALTLAITLGMRRGEICGLRWQDIDFERRLIHICNQRVRLDSGQIIDCSPKSETSDRWLPIPDQLMPILKSNRQLTGYVCSISPSGLDSAHRRLLQKMNLPYIPLHGLRHSMATACIRNGGQMASLQHILGHANYATTANRYTHPDLGMLQSALDCAGRAWYTVLR